MLSEVSPLSSFCKRFYRACAWSWKEFFFLGLDQNAVLENEAVSELTWALSRAGSRHHGMDVGIEDPLAFRKALTETELEHLEAYIASTPGQVYQLNQNPTSGFGSTSTPWALATLIRNCGLLYNADFDRWLFPTELLATQGFPVVPGVYNLKDSANKIPLCSFNVFRPQRLGRHIGAQAGNSMHTFPMTVLQLHSLLCLKYQDIPESWSEADNSWPGYDKDLWGIFHRNG